MREGGVFRQSTSNVRWRALVPDLVGVLWVVAVVFILLLPHVIHGVYPDFTWDQNTELVPWSTLAWSQVHQGHIPLWNPYSALGLPLAFNWQSAPFSITSIVGYLLPQQWAYTTTVMLSAVIAGTGAYVFGRVLRLGVLGSAMAGTTFVLSGSFVAVLAWPVAGVSSWLGWLFAGIVLVVRGGAHRIWSVAFLAVIVAQTVYSGQLDMLGVVALATTIYIVALLAIGAVKRGLRTQLRSTGALSVSIACGVALSAPLLLPGVQLAVASTHTGSVRGGVLTPEAALNTIFAGLGPQAFSPFHVGLIGIVMAFVGAIVLWRKEEVSALATMSVVLGCLTFLPVSYTWLERLPEGGSVQWTRLTVPFCFGLAMLAGVGMDHLARRPYQRGFPELLVGVFTGATLLILSAWALELAPNRSVFRTQMFLWIALSVVVGFLLGAALLRRRALGRPTKPPDQSRTTHSTISSAVSARLGRGWWAVVLLLACETIFLLVAAGPSFVTNSNIQITPTDRALASKVRTALVGFGTNSCFNELPVTPELNNVLHLRELPAYDPMLPSSYFTVWQAASGASARPSNLFEPGTTFCPAITSASLARLFGVTFVVTQHGVAGPSDTVFDGTFGDFDLYRVPGAAVATLSGLGPDGTMPGTNARDRPVSATQPYPGAWRITTHESTRELLRIRVTDVPGWHAAIDGRPLALAPFDKIMFQTIVPPGHHTIVLTYWPTAFSVGLLLAALAVVGLVGALIVGALRANRSRRDCVG